jgi:hypothetical protein
MVKGDKSGGISPLPVIDDDPSNKVTTIRLSSKEHNQVAIFAKAMGDLSMTEFVGRAVRAYLKACTEDPKLKKEIQREITRQQNALNDFAAMVLGTDADG